MNKNNEKLLIYGIAGVAGYYLVLRPLLQKLNIVPDPQEQLVERGERTAVQTQSNLRLPVSANRRYSNASLESLAKELYDSTDTFAYDYPIVMRSFAYFASMTNADALYFLKTFAQSTGQTLYQWQRDKFANATNFKTVDLFPAELNRYKKMYERFGWRFNFLNASFDPLAEKAVGYVYTVAKITKR